MRNFIATCVPCRSMEPVIHALPRNYKVCKVDLDKNERLASHCRVSAVPPLLVYKGGREVARRQGVTPEADPRAEFGRCR